MNKSKKFSPEVRERAVRMVREHRGEYPSLWAAVESIAAKIGCVPQTLLEWVKREEVDAGARPGLSTVEAQRIKDLEREVKELRRANEILKLASAFFAQAELDRRLKS
jgi:transposase-like protein